MLRGVYMYCLEKKLKRYNYKDQIFAWVNNYYFRISTLKEFTEKYTPGSINNVLFKEFIFNFNDFNAWYLVADTDQGLDFLKFVKKYFSSPQEDHEFYFKRTETLVKFLCTKSHDNVKLTKSTYMYTNRIIFNTLCDLQNQATKLYQYFIKKASNDNLRWLMYAMFLYETFFRLNKGEKKIYNEDPLNFYKYAEGRVLIFNENSINSKS